MTWSVWLDRDGPAEHALAPSFSFLIRDFSILRYFARLFWNQTKKMLSFCHLMTWFRFSWKNNLLIWKKTPYLDLILLEHNHLQFEKKA